MNVADAWLITTTMFFVVWGVIFTALWTFSKRGRVTRFSGWALLVVITLSFLSCVGLVWFSTATGIYIRGGVPS